MATTYTTLLKIAKPTAGELDGSWGPVVNDNITSMLEEAIAGRSVINTWSGNSATLSTANGTTAESRSAMLSLTDTGTNLSGAATVICPALSKIYIVTNGAGQIATLKTASGTGIAIPNGATMLLFCDGTNVVEAVSNVTGTLTATAITASGVITGATVEATGDTSASDNAAIGYTSAEGIIVTGQGSTNDITVKNDADAIVIAIPTGTTNVDIVGTATAASFEPDGDTAAGDNAAIGYTSAEGLILTGQGSTNDITVKNDADADVLVIATGTTNVDIVGDATAATFKPDGDTASNDTAAIGYTSAEGIIVTGQGSTNDVTVKNDADTIVIAIPTGTTNVDIVGVATAATFEPDGDTSSGDNAAIGYTSAEGIIVTGQGSTNDVTIKNDADAAVISIPTGTTNVTIAGDLTISGDDLTMGTNTSGAALIADGTNFNPVVISGDATIATDGALTIANNAVSLAKMAGLARGKIIYGDSSGDPAALAVGSSGYFLKSDGTDIAWAAATAASITSYTNSGDNRVITSVDSSTVNGEANLSFDGSVLAVTGNITATGTVEPAGDTAASDNAAIGYTSSEGIIITGQGSTNDVTIKNDADADVITIATGTTNVDVVGDLTAGTLNADGDTASGDNAAIGYTSSEGIIITGQGSTNDVTIKNDADADVIKIATGGTNVEIVGGLTLGTDLSVANGGTGASTFASNNVLLGNGTSAFQAIAPSTSGNVLTSNGSTWSSTAPAGGGKILQVVQHTFTAMVYYASVSSWRTTAITGAITPSASSSKILVMVDSNFGASNYGFMRLRRGSTVIAVGASAGSRLQVSSGSMVISANLGMSRATKQTVTYIDSPSTTSSTTYDVQVIDAGSGNHIRLNGGYTDSDSTTYGRSISTLTLWEIDGS